MTTHTVCCLSHLRTASSSSHGMLVAPTDETDHHALKGHALLQNIMLNKQAVISYYVPPISQLYMHMPRDLLSKILSLALEAAPSSCTMNSVFSLREASCSFSWMMKNKNKIRRSGSGIRRRQDRTRVKNHPVAHRDRDSKTVQHMCV